MKNSLSFLLVFTMFIVSVAASPFTNESPTPLGAGQMPAGGGDFRGAISPGSWA